MSYTLFLIQYDREGRTSTGGPSKKLTRGKVKSVTLMQATAGVSEAASLDRGLLASSGGRGLIFDGFFEVRVAWVTAGDGFFVMPLGEFLEGGLLRAVKDG